ncbi:hypothetical protein H6G76_15365 [Nostoc sp. FACHB-152]|uniref:hypothetical protein n=1 Tax=unclassified Nostoc TaxID=2593658 RepID=UPI001688908B|nr:MULTISPECIES: hypothetical protein [unclassified Nostoc]MBD2448510.1 hypothetical protein [Nostoc sp. FACHB-152]MBD2466247.1 hypothetical protein [Nostoc sp. FACHB-145]
MSTVSCTGCVVILNQQNEQNLAHQQQCQDTPINHSKSKGKNCTVVENGRVVVIPSQPDETAKE